MAVPHQAQIRVQTYLNWVRAGLGLKYTKEGIESFIDNEARVFHSSLLNQLGQPPQNCGQCTADNLLPHQQSSCQRRTNCICSRGPRHMRRLCPNNVCGTLFNAIVSNHRFNGPSLKNSNISQWVTDHWEVAKNFLPITGGYTNIATAADTDLSGLVNIGINMKNITLRHNFTVNGVSGPVDFIKCRTARNDILHNPSQSLTDDQLTRYLNDMKATLQCTAALLNDTAAQQAVTKLTQLETSSFEITDENITEVRRMALMAIQDEGSKQVEAIKEEGEKQKVSVVSSGILVEKRALDEIGFESDRQRKVIKTEVELCKRDAVENIQDEGNQQVETLNVVGEKQIKKIQNEGSGQVKAVTDEGEKQKNYVVVSGLQAEKRALENIQDKGNQQVEAVNVAGEKTIESIQQAATTQADASYQEEKNKLRRHLMDTYIAQLQPATLPEIDRLYVEPRIKLVTDDNVCGDNTETSDDDSDNTDIDRYFKFRKWRSKWRGLQEERDTNINNVFFKKKKRFSRIYISGDAGHGKTALCKMLVLAWCQEHSGEKINTYIPDDFLTAMKKFDFLFYIPLRNIRKDWIISEIIKKQFFEDPDFLNMFIKNECDKSSCLVILDGLDEWVTPSDYETPMHTTHGLPDLSHFTKYTVLTTTRPWKLEELRLGPLEMDRQVQLKGIDKRASDRYIENMVDLLNQKKNVSKESHDFKQHIKAKDLEHFLNIPILLKQLITLWHHNAEEITGRSQVHLYSAMINHLLKDAWERNKKKPLSVGNTQESELPLCLREKQYCKIHKNLLFSLAHLAFTSAFKEQLVFDHVEAEYQNLTEGDINSCLTAGLLCQDIYTSPLDDEKKKLSFLHKTFQDFLAAVYLVIKHESAELPQTCSTGEKILDMRSLFYFVSGMDSEVMTSLIRQIQNILEDNENHLKPIQDLLCECVGASKESGLPPPCCHLEAVFIDNDHSGEFYNACPDWKLQHLISTNMSCIKHVYINVQVDSDKDLLTCLSLVSECRSVQHLNLTVRKSLSQDIVAQMDKAFCDKWSLSSLSLFGLVCEPCYRYLYSDRLTTLVVLNIICVNITNPTECQRLMKGVERATQLKTLDLYEIKYSEDGYREKCSTHLDLSRYSQLQILSLTNCDISKVTINTTSLTNCRVCGTPVYFVPRAVTMIHTLKLGNIRDPHSLDEIVTILPQLTQLLQLSLTCLDFGDRDVCLSLEATHLESVELHYVIMTDRAMIQFLNSVLSTNHKVKCEVKGQLSEAVETYISTRFVVRQRGLDCVDFYSQPAAP